MLSDHSFSLEPVRQISPQSWWLWWRGRLWDPRELQEPLRLCATDPAILQEPAQFLVSPEPPQGHEPPWTLRKAISVGLLQLGASDPFPLFRPEDTESDWHLAGRLYYDFGRASEPHALLYAQRRVAELLPSLWTRQDPLRTAFLAGFTARFLEARKVPPCYCPLASPSGVFLQEVLLLPSGSSARTLAPSEAEAREEAPPATRLGWLLLVPWRTHQRYVVFSPPPALDAVQVDTAVLDRPYPWW